MGGIIASLEPGCIAEELGWRTGDVVESINGHPLQDEIDYRFYSAEELVTVEIRRGRERAELRSRRIRMSLSESSSRMRCLMESERATRSVFSVSWISSQRVCERPST